MRALEYFWRIWLVIRGYCPHLLSLFANTYLTRQSYTPLVSRYHKDSMSQDVKPSDVNFVGKKYRIFNNLLNKISVLLNFNRNVTIWRSCYLLFSFNSRKSKEKKVVKFINGSTFRKMRFQNAEIPYYFFWSC